MWWWSYLFLPTIASKIVIDKATHLVKDAALSDEKGCAANNYCHAPRPKEKIYVKPQGLILRRVILVTRHGDRTPLRPLSSMQPEWQKEQLEEEWCDDNLDDVRGKVVDGKEFALGMAALTPQGRRQLQKLGRELRRIYGNLLRLDISTMHIRSTPYTRTVLSARAFMEGFLPGVPRAKIHFDGTDMNPPIPTAHEASSCPLLNRLIEKVKMSEGYQSMQNRMQTLEEQVKEERASFAIINDNLLCAACHELPVSLASQPAEFCDLGRQAFRYLINAIQSNPQIARLQAGTLMNQLTDELLRDQDNQNNQNNQDNQNNQNNQNNQKNQDNQNNFILFSAHDTTIAYLNAVMQINQVAWPPYASNLIFEVWKSNKLKTAFIRVLYNGQILKLPFCTPIQSYQGIMLVPSEDQLGLCPMTMFKKHLEAYLPRESRDEECAIKTTLI